MCTLLAGQRSRGRSWEAVAALPQSVAAAYMRFAHCDGEGLFTSDLCFDSIPEHEWPSFQPALSFSHFNHSCDSNCWFAYPNRDMLVPGCPLVLVARRSIAVGEEINFDYSTCDIDPRLPSFLCRCGSAGCVRELSWDRFRTLSFQRTFAGHVPLHVARAVALVHSMLELGLSVVDGGDGEGSPGRYLTILAPVKQGELVMVLPANVLRPIAQIPNADFSLQVGADLFSCSLSERDLDNFFAHACDPCLTGTTLPDHTILFTAKRDIISGDSLTFDYEQFEEDMVTAGVSFTCVCGAPSCRGAIVGYGVRKAHNGAASAPIAEA